MKILASNFINKYFEHHPINISNLRRLQSILRRVYYKSGYIGWNEYQLGLNRIQGALDLIA